MDIYILLGENNIVEQWSSSSMSQDEIKLQISEDHPFLHEEGQIFRYIDGELVRCPDTELHSIKQLKDKELNEKCKEVILSGFYHTIKGEEYHFSFDVDAQLNLQGAESLFATDSITEIMWTVTKDGEYKRIKLDKEDMESLSLKVLQHKSGNISRYRDYLLPLVQEAKTREEVNAITWDYDPDKPKPIYAPVVYPTTKESITDTTVQLNWTKDEREKV